jgi:HK97 family phage prohead protease
MAKSVHVRRLEARVAQTAARFVDHATQAGATVADLPTMKLPWYLVRNAAEGVNEAPTVFIFDEIGGSFGVNAQQFARDLEEIDAPAITVRINSPGGSLFDGIAIYNALNHHPARITVYIDALAASAASIIAMAGDEIVMMPGSQMMIHDASAVEDGNSADMAKMSTLLDRQSDNIADLYRMRAGGDLAGWRDLMLAETWMFAREAVAMRLADRIEEPTVASRPDMPTQMTRAFDLSHFRFAGRAAAPTPGNADAARPANRRSTNRATDVDGGKAARALTKGAERRGYPAQYEIRGKAGSTVEVRGYATVYNTPYEMFDSFGSYSETVRSGAGQKTLSENPQVQFLANHGGLSMAYTKARTLSLSEDSTGLEIVASLDGRRGDVSDLLLAIERGDLDEMSFAFRVPTGKSIWSDDYDRRDITEYDLSRGDVSAVNFGANPTTNIGMRAEELDRMEEAAARSLYERLGRRLIIETPRARQVRADVDPPVADAPDTVPCPACGAMNAPDAIYCDQCGAALDGSSGPAESSVETEAVTDSVIQTQRRPALTLQDKAADDDARARAVLIGV